MPPEAATIKTLAPKTLALITIGQAPRVDLTPDIMPLFEGINVIEAGALDEFSPAEIAGLRPRAGEGVLVSRLRSGGHAVLSEERIHPLIQQAVDRAVSLGATAILVVCTGDIPGLSAPVPLYLAEALAHGAVAALIGEAPLTVVVPEPEQAGAIAARWARRLGREVTTIACDPYTEPLARFAELGAGLDAGAAGSAGWLFLDCIGYSEAMAAEIRANTGARVLTARTLAARLVTAAL